MLHPYYIEMMHPNSSIVFRLNFSNRDFTMLVSVAIFVPKYDFVTSRTKRNFVVFGLTQNLTVKS